MKRDYHLQVLWPEGWVTRFTGTLERCLYNFSAITEVPARIVNPEGTTVWRNALERGRQP